jgi:uncharacterized UPF0160 family protein
MDVKNLKTLYIHGSVFHGDDMMCATMLRQINPEIEIKRITNVTDKIRNEPDSIIADIGFGEFDHHQKDAKTHPDGTKYSAATLIYEQIKDQLFPNGAPTEFEEELRKIELHDNGVQQKPMPQVTNLCVAKNPPWNSTRTQDELFFETLDIVQKHYMNPFATKGHQSATDKFIIRERTRTGFEILTNAEQQAKEAIQKAVENSPDPKIINFERYMPWQTTLPSTNAEFVILPSDRGGYLLQCVPPEPKSFEQKVPLPRAWLDEPPEGCTFIHPARFLSAFDTRENANKAALSIIYPKRKLPEIEQIISEKAKTISEDISDFDDNTIPS